MEAESNMTGAGYCAPGFQHAKGPNEGWRGIKDGKMFIDGDDPLNFIDWLRQLKNQKWEAAWEYFGFVRY